MELRIHALWLLKCVALYVCFWYFFFFVFYLMNSHTHTNALASACSHETYSNENFNHKKKIVKPNIEVQFVNAFGVKSTIEAILHTFMSIAYVSRRVWRRQFSSISARLPKGWQTSEKITAAAAAAAAVAKNEWRNNQPQEEIVPATVSSHTSTYSWTWTHASL